MKKIFKYMFITFILIILFTFITILIYARITYIDESVTAGSAYGFNISDSKIETYHNAKENFKNKEIFIQHPIDKQGVGPYILFKFADDDYVILSEKTDWNVYFDKSFYNFLELKFRDNKLVEIYRHRNKFELP